MNLGDDGDAAAVVAVIADSIFASNFVCAHSIEINSKKQRTTHIRFVTVKALPFNVQRF